jgi:hypothetical protein
MQQLTKEQAVDFYNKGDWKSWTHEEIVKFQLFQEKLCMDFSRFHQAMEAVLGRPVYTHEFAYKERLIQEYFGTKRAPTGKEILDLLGDKVVVTNI